MRKKAGEFYQGAMKNLGEALRGEKESFSERSGGGMIELDLGKVLGNLMWDLKVLAAVRCVCAANEIDVTWIANHEQMTAELIRNVRRIIAVKGEVMQIRKNTG